MIATAARALATLLVAGGMLAASAATTGPVAGAASAASAAGVRHESPYVRAARQHAQEASAPVLKVNPVVQHRPRVPASMHHG